jgi:hypothetical protein
MKKHLNKILVFSLNFLLMLVAILVIKEKDQARLSEKQQNDLLDSNASLSNENSALKNELQSLKRVVEDVKSAITGEEQKVDAPTADAQTPDIPVSANTSTQAKPLVKKPSKSSSSNSSKKTSSNNSATSNSTVSPVPATAPSPAATTPASNSKTKTS